MTYLIWHSAKNEVYSYGTEADLHVHESLTGESFTVLYEMDHSQLYLVKKIVDQLNSARQEYDSRKLVAK